MKQIKTWALLPLATLCMSSNALAQTTDPWTITEPTGTSKGSISIPSNYKLDFPGYVSASFNMDPEDSGSLFKVNVSRYFEKSEVKLFTISPYCTGNCEIGSTYLALDGWLHLGGTSLEIYDFSIKKVYEDSGNTQYWTINSKKDMRGAGSPQNIPLWFTASEYQFLEGNVLTDGTLRVGKAAGTVAMINADCYMTNYKYLLQLSNYGHNQFSVDDSGNVKSGRSLELGMSEGGHLLIQADAELGTKISNETEGSYFHPFTVDASTYVFNIKGKDTCFAINGGSLNVDGEINCKGKMKVAEINSDQINTKDIKVEMNNAADYVFDESYNLKPLNEVETFVKNEKHLPGIPSASEMAKEGMSVSQMSNLLLEKVEELTLHMIEMQKQIDELKAENQSLKEGMNK